MKDVLIIDDDGELLQSLARAISPLIAPFLHAAQRGGKRRLSCLSVRTPRP